MSAPFHSQGDIKANVKAIRFIPILYAAIALFATNIYGASLKDVTRSGGDASYDSAINQNFDRVGNELSNVMHKTSTETIHGYKYFVDPVDFGLVNVDSATIGAATVSSATITTLDSPVVRYHKPELIYVSTNAVAISSNTGTTNETCVLFPDGNYRCVTENNSSADKYRLWQATATANFTSGTEDSGLRSTYVRTANTKYFLYFVKSAIDATKWVVVGDTITPVAANYSTLNTAYGTNGWVYAGQVWNGDGASSTNTILKFVKTGNRVVFSNATSGAQVANNAGYRLATTASATSLTYTYAAGTGAGQIPNNIKIVTYSGHLINSSGNSGCTDTTGNVRYMFLDRNCRISDADASLGLLVEIGGANKADIFLTGFVDDALTDGAGAF